MRLVKIVCVTCILVMLTAIVELFFPGRQIIPGWIGLASKLGEGNLKYRLEGMRAGGAFESHGMLSDFGTQMILFMVFFGVLAKNPMEKVFWMLGTLATIVAILATANRGATTGLVLGAALALIYFRRSLGLVRISLIVVAACTGLIVMDAVLSEHTLAVSVMDRFRDTTFEGMVPENRVMTWAPTLKDALKKPFFGHGPFYDTGIGLTKRYWPHNGYLFYFYTLGLFGLGAFLWLIARVYGQSRVWKAPRVRHTRMGAFLAIAQIWLIVFLWEQLRTDHQRDDIYPYIMWMCFGVIVTGASVARRQMNSNGQARTAATPSLPSA
jgi:O-antigen ligase